MAKLTFHDLEAWVLAEKGLARAEALRRQETDSLRDQLELIDVGILTGNDVLLSVEDEFDRASEGDIKLNYLVTLGLLVEKLEDEIATSWDLPHIRAKIYSDIALGYLRDQQPEKAVEAYDTADDCVGIARRRFDESHQDDDMSSYRSMLDLLEGDLQLRRAEYLRDEEAQAHAITVYRDAFERPFLSDRIAAQCARGLGDALLLSGKNDEAAPYIIRASEVLRDPVLAIVVDTLTRDPPITDPPERSN